MYKFLKTALHKKTESNCSSSTNWMYYQKFATVFIYKDASNQRCSVHKMWMNFSYNWNFNLLTDHCFGHCFGPPGEINTFITATNTPYTNNSSVEIADN